ncbi:MAG: hypothetical protein KFB93_04755 [Simkaniaceae bacterium]|jgi:hypothetical protein|nr:MAG: hypothetical protein KFB93_04755 [Simkaniaceae bacterium]
MGLQKLFNAHFNPSSGPKQVPDDSFQSNALGLTGLALIATAAIGHQFFSARAKTAAMLASAGAGFFASYLSEKDGYALLVVAAAASGMTYAAVDAVNSGRLWVTVHFDIAEIIRAARETHARAH